MHGFYLGCFCCVALTATAEPEISFDIWDWTKPAQDLEKFDSWVGDLVGLGVNRIEISVPWRKLEVAPGVYDLTWLDDRVALCERHGVGMRLRINSYYGGATPEWYEGDRWMDVRGEGVPQSLPSIMDERFWAHYGPLCTRIAARCQGKDVIYNAFIGIHAELKYGDWWSYDPSTLAAWRKAIAETRPAWLLDVAGNAALPERPDIPPDTSGSPDMHPAHRAFIAFREHCWREAVARFENAIRQGHPEARISAPLGESYRRRSASMANLDYWGLSRGAEQVVHSYDFFWHNTDPAWMGDASLAAFSGITGLPVVFEFDGTQSMFQHGHSVPQLMALGQAAAHAGAGLKLANNSYTETLPSEQPLLGELIRLWREEWQAPVVPAKADTVLLFLSKWASYSYREASQWLHDAQFGVYRLLREAGIPVRIICEDNLDEALDGYRALYLAFSPRALLPDSARAQLATLTVPIIEDFHEIPTPRDSVDMPRASGLAEVALGAADCPVGPEDLSKLGAEYAYALALEDKQFLAYKPGHAVMGYPVGALYLHDEHPCTHSGLVLWALQQVTAD